jgi:hypothetical protein
MPIALQSSVSSVLVSCHLSGSDFGTGPSQVNYSAHWRKDNDNPALANFLKLLSERYPLPCAG